MTPGLAFFYGGLVRDHTTLTMMSQNVASMGVTTVLWAVVLFSLCFGEPLKWSAGVYGDPRTFALTENMGIHEPLRHGLSGGVDAKIPGVLFAFYQCMFAVVTPALMTGAFADRLRYAAWLWFLVIWLFVVYAPWCHMLWGGGLLSQMGVVDYAGGLVVHTTAGFSALALVLVLGRRPAQIVQAEPHSVPLVLLGTSLLWFGWFGFNCGSALGANSVAAVAGWNSQIAAATGMAVWTALDWVFQGKPGLISKCVGAIAGLAAVTPASGFISPPAAMLLGAVAAPACYVCVALSNFIGFDDALDVFGVHGMGGFLGTALVGVLADGPECSSVHNAPSHCVNPGTVTRSVDQFLLQLQVVSLCAVYSFGASYFLLKFIGCFVHLTPPADAQHVDLDSHQHGEVAYTKHSLHSSLLHSVASSEAARTKLTAPSRIRPSTLRDEEEDVF